MSYQNRVDAAQMELTRLTCEANSLLSSVEQRKREIDNEERKLQKANLSQQQLVELNKQISSVESLLSELPVIDEERTEDLRSQRQVLQKEVDVLKEQCRMAEKFAETEGVIERKRAQRDEVKRELDTLMKKHSDTLSVEFGSVIEGPWSVAVNAKLKSEEESNASMENDLRTKERDLDRISQSLQQAINTEKQLVGEVEQLREKISELCECAPQDVGDNLSETRLLLSKSRRELAALRTKATLYESWSEEVTKRSCCPLCERRFTSKTGAIELSGKLLDMSLAVPDDIERLERQVQEAEEKERRLASALIHVEQCKKIMDGKVKVVRKEVSDYNKEEESLTEELERLRTAYAAESSSFKRLLDVKADVSLMDSLLTTVRSLSEQIDELSKDLGSNPTDVSLSTMKKELTEKEESISSLSSQIENFHLALSERNRLTSKVRFACDEETADLVQYPRKAIAFIRYLQKP
ncbi:hypothetical protein COOONC_05965 [Cooperia oncophora]